MLSLSVTGIEQSDSSQHDRWWWSIIVAMADAKTWGTQAKFTCKNDDKKMREKNIEINTDHDSRATIPVYNSPTSHHNSQHFQSLSRTSHESSAHPPPATHHQQNHLPVHPHTHHTPKQHGLLPHNTHPLRHRSPQQNIRCPPRSRPTQTHAHSLPPSLSTSGRSNHEGQGTGGGIRG